MAYFCEHSDEPLVCINVGNSWLCNQLLASQGGLCCMESFGWLGWVGLVSWFGWLVWVGLLSLLGWFLGWLVR